MLLDPEIYPDPDHFKPARFLNKSSSSLGLKVELDTNVADPSAIVFGFGRRACPGRWLAYDSLWISIASLLATFDILPAKDRNGCSIPPRGECIDNFMSYVRIFRFASYFF